MLVKHLIRELQKCNPNAQVITEGCDCYGDTYRVVVDTETGKAEIERSDNKHDPGYKNEQDTTFPIAQPLDTVI